MTIVGAFLTAAAQAKHLQVGIELIGTPAEEKGGGKIDLLEKGVFRDSVAALFSHPGSGGEWSVSERLLGINVKRVIYEGLASHAAVSPEKGRNALTALIALFVAVDGCRQHLPPTARVHGIVREGGVASNIIPSRAVGGLRHPRGGDERIERNGRDVREHGERRGAPARHEGQDRGGDAAVSSGRGEPDPR